MKNKFGLIYIFLIGILLFSQLSFMGSQEILDLIDIGLEIGFLEGEIKGIGIETTKLSGDITSFTFIIKNAVLYIKDNLYTNIIPHGTDDKKAYINVNKNAEITQADFTTNERGGNYTFGDKTYEVPPNSQVYFSEETGVELEVADGTDLSKFPSLLDYISGGYLTTIKGKDITLPNGINLIDGELSIERNGFLLKNGKVNYKQNLLNVARDRQILIANPNADLSDYDGNWLRQTDKILELQSAEDGLVSIDFLENHEILNTDDKDNLAVSIRNGDGLIFESGVEEGLAPNIIYKSSENGKTILNNGIDLFTLKKDGFFMKPPRPLSLEDIRSGKYQTVNLRIGYGDEELLAGSFNDFEIAREDNTAARGYNTVVTINTDGFPVSTLIKENECQTIDCLINLYPNITFGVPEEINERYFLDFPATNELDEEMLPPALIRLTEHLIKSDLYDPKYFDKIQFGYAPTAALVYEPGIIDLLTLYVPPTEEEREAAAREAARREMLGLDKLVPSGAYYIGLGLTKLGLDVGEFITEEVVPPVTIEEFAMSVATGAMGRIKIVGRSPPRIMPRKSGLGKIELRKIEYTEKALYGMDPTSIGNVKVINVKELPGRGGVYLTDKQGYMSLKRRFRSTHFTFTSPADMVNVRFQGVAEPIATRSNMWEHYVKGVNMGVY